MKLTMWIDVGVVKVKKYLPVQDNMAAIFNFSFVQQGVSSYITGK